jgi:hypothetical protein
MCEPPFTTLSTHFASHACPHLTSLMFQVLNGANFRNDIGTPMCRFGQGAPAVAGAFLSSRTMLCSPQIVPMGQRVLVEISFNGQDFEAHKSQTYSFFGQAPVVTLAGLSGSYCEIDFAFNVDTNRAETDGSFACSRVLGWEGTQPLFSLSASELASALQAGGDEGVFQAMFGANTQCTFPNNRTLRMGLGYNGKFRIGQALAIKGDKIMRGTELTYFASGNVTISTPNPAPKPSVKLSYASQIGSCDRLVASAAASSESACRPLHFEWSIDQVLSVVTDDNLTPTQKRAILAAFNSLLSNFSGIAFDALGVQCRHSGCRECLATDSAGTCIRRSNTTFVDCRCDQIDVDVAWLPEGRYALKVVARNWLGVSSDPTIVTVTKVTQLLSIQLSIRYTQYMHIFLDPSVRMCMSSGASLQPFPPVIFPFIR